MALLKEVLLTFTRDGKNCSENATRFYIISKQVAWNCFSLLHNTLERVLNLFKSFHNILASGPRVLEAFGSDVLQYFTQRPKRDLKVLKAFTQYCKVLSWDIKSFHRIS